MTAEAQAGSRDLRRLKGDRDWFGYLTLENCEAVADRIRTLLAGRRYTFVAVSSGSDYRPEVRTGQELRDKGITSYLNDGKDDGGGRSAGISASDTYGAWGLHVFKVADQEAACERRKAAWEKAGEDQRRGWEWQDKRLTYLHIRHDRIEIEHFAMAGFRIYWTVVVEPEAEVSP